MASYREMTTLCTVRNPILIDIDKFVSCFVVWRFSANMLVFSWFPVNFLQGFLYFGIFFAVLLADFHPITIRDKVMVKQVYRVFNVKDWMRCLLECNGDSKCSSYNFQYDANPSSEHICELSECAMNKKREKGLIARRGFLFQQLKQSKVILSYL